MYILGIHDGHDASAALMKDGVIIAAVQEERFTGLKGDYGYPKQAIAYCLDSAGITSKEIDTVALSSFTSNPVLTYIKRNANFSVTDWIDEQEKYWKPLKFEKQTNNYYMIYKDRFSKTDKYYNYDGLLEDYMGSDTMQKFLQRRIECIHQDLAIDKEKIIVTNHEMNHKSYALFASPYRDQDVLILTSEGIGDEYNGTVSTYQNGEIVELATMKENHLGHIYQYITLILGMKPAQHEYKVMGLAPYANDYETNKAYKVFRKYLKVENLEIKFDQQPSDLYYTVRDELKDCRFDGIAGGVQKFLEEVLCEWVQNCVKHTGIKTVVMAGGVAQNIKAMKSISELDCVDSIFVPPAAGDTSNSVGACYNIAYQKNLQEISPLKNIYLGPSFTIEDIEKAIEMNGLEKDFIIKKDIGNSDIAQLLSEGNIIGLMRGRMEFGLRALGNRSIIADPSNPMVLDFINQKVKNRDFWMPFTPSMLDYRAKDYIANPKNLYSPYMAMAFDSIEENRKAFPAAMHPADKTVRAQIVEKEKNSPYYDLIQKFEEISGNGVILNTSFNLHGNTVVLGPEEAIYTFINSQIDVLVMENIMILRKNV